MLYRRNFVCWKDRTVWEWNVKGLSVWKEKRFLFEKKTQKKKKKENKKEKSKKKLFINLLF